MGSQVVPGRGCPFAGALPGCAQFEPGAVPESVIYGYDAVTQTQITLTATIPIVPLSGGVLNDGRYLYVGSYDGANGILHRFDLSTHSEDTSVLVQYDGAVVAPSFVAVVP